MNLNTVLFDLDGTLIDSIHDMSLAYNQLLTQHKKPTYPLIQLRPLLRSGPKNPIEKDFKTKAGHPRYQKIRAEFSTHYQAVIQNSVTVFSGISHCLKHLDKNNIPWAIVTNKSLRSTTNIVKSLKIFQTCRLVVCPETVGCAKPNPEPIRYACQQLRAAPSQTLMIGDTEVDAKAAQRAQVQSLAVGYSAPLNKNIIRDWSVIDLIHTPDHLCNWLQKHIN